MSHATSFKAHIQSPFTLRLTARVGAEGVTAEGVEGERGSNCKLVTVFLFWLFLAAFFFSFF